MIHIRLSEEDVRDVAAAFRSTDDRKYRDRLQIVLLAHKGRKRQDIAADLAINRRSVQRWLNAYCERGLPGLTPRCARPKRGSPDGLNCVFLLQSAQTARRMRWDAGEPSS